MGLDGCIKPDGGFTGTTNDKAEIPKWDALGLTRSEQDAKIREMLEKQRRKEPGFLPNTWRWFTTGMADLAEAKRRSPSGAKPQYQPAMPLTDPQAEAERQALIAGLERLGGANSDAAFDKRCEIIARLKTLQLAGTS